ncbi:MAG: SDR family NAD(P)-dependent oxidoreductase, partial [Pseudomonadales bacterium]
NAPHPIPTRLDGKVAIVTGAGQTPGVGLGNGRATALLFARHGARIFATDRDANSLQDTAEMIKAEGGHCETFAMDVTSEDDCEQMARQCVAALGRVDILHNNVGIGAGDNSVGRISLQHWQRIMDVNLTSMMLTSKHVLPSMREQESGVILNISSLAAIAATNMVAYKTSKAGVMALTENLAMANARFGIRANCILPGLINTPMAIEGLSVSRGVDRDALIAQRNKMVPLKQQMGSPWDVAQAALFLASDEAGFITGINLPVDGGQSKKVG